MLVNHIDQAKTYMTASSLKHLEIISVINYTC